MIREADTNKDGKVDYEGEPVGIYSIHCDSFFVFHFALAIYDIKPTKPCRPQIRDIR